MILQLAVWNSSFIYCSLYHSKLKLIQSLYPCLQSQRALHAHRYIEQNDTLPHKRAVNCCQMMMLSSFSTSTGSSGISSIGGFCSGSGMPRLIAILCSVQQAIVIKHVFSTVYRSFPPAESRNIHLAFSTPFVHSTTEQVCVCWWLYERSCLVWGFAMGAISHGVRTYPWSPLLDFIKLSFMKIKSDDY